MSDQALPSQPIGHIEHDMLSVSVPAVIDAAACSMDTDRLLLDQHHQHCIVIKHAMEDLSLLVRNDLLLVLLPSLPSAVVDAPDGLIVKTDDGIFSRLDIARVCRSILLVIEQGLLGLESEVGSTYSGEFVIDITDSQVVDFLLVTLPIMTEAFLKRRTKG